MRRLATLLCLASPLTLAAQAPALTPTALHRGDRIEVGVRHAREFAQASFVSLTGDTLYLRYRDMTDSVGLAIPNVERLRVHRGTERAIGRYALRGLIGGFAVGAAIGLAAGLADPKGAEFFDGPGGAAALFGIGLAVPSAMIGGLLGISVDRWEDVSLPARP